MDHGVHISDILSQHSDKMHDLLLEVLKVWMGELGYTQAGSQRREATLENSGDQSNGGQSLLHV